MPDLLDVEEEFSAPEMDAGDAPREGSLVGNILGGEGAEPLPPLPEEEAAEELPGEDGPRKKKTSPLLVLLLLLAAAYGAYAYIIPSYFPELLSSSPTAPPAKAPAPKRIAVKPPQKQVAPKPVPAEEPKLALEKAKGESIPARPAPLEEEVKPESAPEPEPEKALSLPAEKIRVAKADLPVKGDQGFLVQAGAFIFKSNIKAPISKIKEAGYTPRVETAYKSVAMNRLTVGEWDSFEEANTATLDLQEQGYIRAKVLPLGGDKFTVLIDSYYYKHLAVEESIILEVKGFDAEIVKKSVRMKIYHILLGPYATAEEVAKVEEALKEKGLETAVLKNKNR
jgi:cell division protein FtsN